MRLVTHQAAFTQDVARLIVFANNQGFEVTLGEAYRTAEQQAIHVRAGRSKTMKSNHLRRLAIDFNFFKSGKLTYDIAELAIIGAYWESLNTYNRWGGNFSSFKDVPHFERNIP